MFFHLWPCIIPIIIAIAADNNKAIWLGPPKELSPYIYTLYERSEIRNIIGDSARKNDILFDDLITYYYDFLSSS